MHSAIKKTLGLAMAALTVVPALAGDYDVVKREMRSAWVATVWRIDWPPSAITQTGNTNQINAQKTNFTKMLDSLQVNNLNAVNFQVRSRCDAMYKSSYEPWSSDLVATRGMDPGWDPLAFAVEECHKRGMECHAWINPYRYTASVSETPFKSHPLDYAITHPEWLITVGNAQILNPALPEVIQRICDVAGEIVANYDVDGLLFDDYFYLSGTPASADAAQYNAYKAAGGTLALNDWRRDNVNRMVAAVNKRIHDTKPWVRFGISPAGVCCTTSAMANKYGVSVCPSGSDWQYNDICSEPLAWISSKSLDYVSPQVYWTIGYSAADYGKITPWWSQIAQKFGRHIYISPSITTLTGSSSAPGLSQRERSLSVDGNELMGTGPNGNTFEEYKKEILLTRSSNLDGAPGTIFWSVSYLWSKAPKFGHYLRNTVFTTPAIMPAMTWFSSSDPGHVKNITRNGNTLTWDGYDNVRYTIYAIPLSESIENFQGEPESLLGVSYKTSYEIPANRRSGYKFLVCVYDRFGYEYGPAIEGVEVADLDKAVLVSPKGGQSVEHPFDFEWKSVEGANKYTVEVARDAAFTNRVGSADSPHNTLSSTAMPGLPTNETLYWRVIANGISVNASVSDVESFKMTRVEITSPEANATGVDLDVLIKWNSQRRSSICEVALDPDFENIVASGESTSGRFNVPAYTLMGYTTYYARARYTINGVEGITPTIMFTTKEADIAAPTIKHPVDGGRFYGDEFIESEKVDGPTGLTFQLDTKVNVGARYVQESVEFPAWTMRNKAGELSKTLEKDKVYYMRVRATYRTASGNKQSDWSPVISATYGGESSGVEDVMVDNEAQGDVKYINLQGIRVTNPNGGVFIRQQGGTATKELIK